jgi:RNase P subunit RPR2
MEQRIFHGDFTAQTLAGCLISYYNQGNLKVQVIGENPTVMVQIASADQAASGGKTALSILLQNVEDGVAVKVGQQNWLGIAASMGFTALLAMRNPFTLITRIDDLAQDIENLQLTEEVWKMLEENARILGTGYELSERLKRYICEYCNTANPPGEPTCVACGAPLGNVQPTTCKNCGYILINNEFICPNCKKKI